MPQHVTQLNTSLLLPCLQCLLRHWLQTTDAAEQAEAADDNAQEEALWQLLDCLELPGYPVLNMGEWAAQHAATDSDALVDVLSLIWEALHPTYRHPETSLSLYTEGAEILSALPASIRWETLAQGLLGPATWPNAGSASWWAVHAAVVCQDVAGLKLVLHLGASASPPVPVPYSEALAQLVAAGFDAASTKLTPLCLCLPLRGQGVAAGPSTDTVPGFCTASGQAYDLARMTHMVCLLKDYGAQVSELMVCGLETLEELAVACVAGAIGLLRALLERRGPSKQKAWESTLLTTAAQHGRWRLLQCMLAAQPQQPVHVLQCLAINAAQAGQCRLVEWCLARVPTMELPGVVHKVFMNVADWDRMPEEQVSCVLLGSTRHPLRPDHHSICQEPSLVHVSLVWVTQHTDVYTLGLVTTAMQWSSCTHNHVGLGACLTWCNTGCYSRCSGGATAAAWSQRQCGIPP